MSSNLDMVDDDDDISITSTAPSEQKDEYEVETILTELYFPGEGVKYLVKWEGYPIERSTWEPEESFLDPQTLRDWVKKKQAIERGELPEFVLEEWENRVEAFEDARDVRKRRRRAKRIRLGLETPSGEADAAGDSSNHDASVKREQRQGEELDSDDSLANEPIIRDIPSKTAKAAPTQPDAENLKSGRQNQGIEPDGVKDSPSATSSGRTILSISTPSQPATSHPGHPSTRNKSSSNPHTVSANDGGRALARRTAPSILGFRTRHPKTKNLGTGIRVRLQRARTGQLSPTAAKRFKTLSMVWRYEKAARSEPEPDINQLQLRRPSEWSSKPNTLIEAKSTEVQPTKDSDSLFVEQDSPPTSEDSNGIPPTDLPSPQRPQLSRTVSEDTGSPFNQRQELPLPPKLPLSLDSLPEPATENNACCPHLQKAHPSPTQIPTGPRMHSWGTNGMEPPREPRATYRGRALNPPPKTVRPSANRFWNPGETLVSMYYGPSKQEVGAVRICGVTYTTKGKLLSLKANGRIDVWFQHLCTLEQYAFLCERMQNIKYCNGWIEGLSDTTPEINKMAAYLRDQDLIGICYLPGDNPQNVLVAYATDSETFDFLNQDAFYPPGVSLRLAVRSGLSPIETLPTHLSPRPSSPEGQVNSAPPATSLPPMSLVPAPPLHCNDDSHPQHTENKPEPPNIQGESAKTDTEMTDSVDVRANIDLDVIFKEQYGITFNELSRVNGEKRDNRVRIFYLMFPPEDQAQAECEVVLQFLKKHNVVTFSNRVSEDWERFAQVVDHGVVLCHGDFVNFEALPYLRDLFRKQVNFWSLSLAVPLKYADSPVPIHIQRIFPHGGVILLTEDFMIHEQDAAVIILAWFRDWIKKKFPGTWKIMFRPDIENWLLRKHDEDRKNGHWITMYHLLRELLPEEYQDHLQGDEPRELDGLDDEEFPVLSLARLPDYGHRSEDEHPAIPKGLTQQQRDTDHLLEFFAGWGLVHNHRFRRFVAVTSMEPLPRWKEWHHLELRHGGRDFLKTFKVDYKSYWNKLTAPAKEKDATSTAPSQTSPVSSSPQNPAAPGKCEQ